MAGRATGYSDFYKNKDNTPGDNPDTEEEMDITQMSPEDKKKMAIRKRLMRMRKVGK